MERYLQIGKTNLKHNLPIHLCVAIAFLLLSPIIMSTQNLNAARTAKVLEMYTALLGIILITPVFLPEQDKDLRELVESKYTSRTAVTLIRLFEGTIFLTLLIGADIFVLKQNQCIFPVMYYYYGTMAEAVFLGGLGLCASSIFDQIAIAYMLPIVYYAINMGAGKKYVGNFYLFSMCGGSYREKVYLAFAGMVLIILGITYPYIIKRVLPKVIPHTIREL